MQLDFKSLIESMKEKMTRKFRAEITTEGQKFYLETESERPKNT